MDVRTTISDEKHFINIPKPLFEYLCTLDLSRGQEHVFLLHWGEGKVRGDWKSKLSISCVAKELSISPSTVKRAYAKLMEKGLIRRHSQGRCPHNPMRSDTTITEVIIPDDAVAKLLNAPSRAQSTKGASKARAIRKPTVSEKQKLTLEAQHDDSEMTALLTTQPTDQKQSAGSKKAAYEAYLQDVEKGRVSNGFAARLRQALRERLDESEVNTSWHEMLWSIEHGALSEQPLPKAYNVAMKLLRQKRWKTPWDMPDDWQWGAH